MSKPHVCPVCNGNGKRFSEGSTASIQYEQCPACLGACVLWEPPHIVELGAPQPFIPFTPYEPYDWQKQSIVTSGEELANKLQQYRVTRNFEQSELISKKHNGTYT